METIYATFRSRQIPLDFVEANDLEENILGTETVLVPSAAGLSGQEVERLRRFGNRAGGTVIIFDGTDDCPIKEAQGCAADGDAVAALVDDLIERGRVIEPVQIENTEANKDLDVRCLRSHGALVIIIANFGAEKKRVSLALHPHVSAEVPLSRGTVYQPNGRLSVVPENSGTLLRVTISQVNNGAFVVLE